jgi:hypothetical protein
MTAGLRFAYNTNGVANHRLDDALSLIADSGYDGVALTLDHHHLDPFAPDFDREVERFARRLQGLGLGCVVETGARFLLDPRQKHEPTLVTRDREGRAARRVPDQGAPGRGRHGGRRDVVLGGRAQAWRGARGGLALAGGRRGRGRAPGGGDGGGGRD